MTPNEVLGALETMLAFCHSLGLGDRAEGGRFGEYRQQLCNLVELLQRGAADEGVKDWVALGEAAEFSGLLPYLKTRPREEVIDKLREVLDGPYLPSKERPSAQSNRPRNIQFELYLASFIARTRFRPILGSWPDLRCDVDGTMLFFECKRIISADRLRERMNEAADQLKNNRKRSRCNAGGVIAISLSRVRNPANETLEIVNQLTSRDALGRWLKQRADAVHKHIEMLVQQKKVFGVLFHAASAFVNPSMSRYEFANLFHAVHAASSSPYSRAVATLSHELHRVQD